MCGGAGTGLWPASRENRPKQFLLLLGRYSTFRETIRRVSNSALFGRPIIVTNKKFVDKPDAQTAERYVSTGYLWNSGNFIFRHRWRNGQL